MAAKKRNIEILIKKDKNARIITFIFFAFFLISETVGMLLSSGKGVTPIVPTVSFLIMALIFMLLSFCYFIRGGYLSYKLGKLEPKYKKKAKDLLAWLMILKAFCSMLALFMVNLNFILSITQ